MSRDVVFDEGLAMLQRRVEHFKRVTMFYELKDIPHVAGVFFVCGDCGQTKPVGTECGTGYGYWYDNPDIPICYDCCAKRQRQSMIDAGKAVLYLVFRSKEVPDYHPKVHTTNHGWHITDFGGKLDFPAIVHKGRHNIARTQYVVRFRGPDGYWWTGRQYGDNTQVCRCRRTKEKVLSGPAIPQGKPNK